MLLRNPHTGAGSTEAVRHCSSLQSQLGRGPVQCSGVTCLRRHFSQAAAISGPREHIKMDNSEQSEHGPCLICSGVMKQQPSGSPVSALPASARAGQPCAQFSSDRQRTDDTGPVPLA